MNGAVEFLGAGEMGSFMKQHSILCWHRIARLQCHWTVFQAIRYALWLVR
jgi:hypothetical protein